MQADQVVQFMNGSIEQDLDKTGSKKSFLKRCYLMKENHP